jgi:hypothetical protein
MQSSKVNKIKREELSDQEADAINGASLVIKKENSKHHSMSELFYFEPQQKTAEPLTSEMSKYCCKQAHMPTFINYNTLLLL